MVWTVFLVLSLICLLSCIIFAYIRSKTSYKSGRLLDPLKILFIGVIFSSFFLFVPIYINELSTNSCGNFEAVLLAIHHMMKMFIVDADYEIIISNLAQTPALIFKGYTLLFLILMLLAPLLTFGFVLSFFKNISAYKRYISHFNSDVYIFSELNEKSLALAHSLYKNCPKHRCLVFTNVCETNQEQNSALVEGARELGAVCFKKDIVDINFFLHNAKTEFRFFTIGDNQSENVSKALKLIDKLKHRENTHLYVFSTQVEAEILLANAFENIEGNNGETFPPKIKVRRVNEVQSVVFRNLYEKGFEKIFCSARYDEGIKKINALVIGMGNFGTEMTKALSWFCQMDGFRVQIDCFDINKNANDIFCALCPGLMDSQLNGNYDIEGEAKYKITVHSGVDVNTKTFEQAILALPQTTYVFIALGDDEKNISTAIKLRALFEKRVYAPQIQAIIYNSDKKQALCDITNFKGQSYNIDFIGDTDSSYSQEAILESDIEKKALERHRKWGSERDFWQYDYNYKSSMASAIHREMKIKCSIAGAQKAPEDRTQDQLWAIRILEHCRWSAYMRSEGYVYSGAVEKSTRNDLAKMHNCLVPFGQLSLEDKDKDDD